MEVGEYTTETKRVTDVRLVFEGSPNHLRVEVPAGVASAPPHPGLTEARELAEQQGGRVTGDLVASGVTVWMPRR